MKTFKEGQAYRFLTDYFPEVSLVFSNSLSSAEVKFSGQSEIISINRKQFWKNIYEIKKGLKLVGETYKKKWYKNEQFIKINFEEYKYVLRNNSSLELTISKNDTEIFFLETKFENKSYSVSKLNIDGSAKITEELLYLYAFGLFYIMLHLESANSEVPFIVA